MLRQNNGNEPSISPAESSSANLLDSSITIPRPLAVGEINLKIGTQTQRASFEFRSVVDGAAELIVNAESAAARIATALWVTASTLAKKPAFAAAAAALGIGVVAENLKGSLMPDGSSSAAYITKGSDEAGKVLWFQATTGTGGIEHVSATYLDPWDVLTAAHCVTGSTGTVAASSILIGTGSNYLTDPGTVVGAASFSIYPTYDGTFESPDLAIIHLTSPLPGSDMAIASTSAGEILEGGGFGSYGTPSTGLLPADGNSRGWQAPVVEGNPSNVSDVYYISTDFDSNDHISLNGKALSGDSGGPELAPSGSLVGINIAQQGNTDAIGTTVSLNLSQPDILSWIQQNESVPEPASLSLSGAVTGGLLLRRIRKG